MISLDVIKYILYNISPDVFYGYFIYSSLDYVDVV